MLLLFLGTSQTCLEMQFNRLGKTSSESQFFLFAVSVAVSKSCFVRSTDFGLKEICILNQAVLFL